MHKLLAKQIKRNNITFEEGSDLHHFVEAVANTYTQMYQEQVKFEESSNRMLSKISHTNENLQTIIETIDSFNYHLSHDLKTSIINNISLTRMVKKYYEKQNQDKMKKLIVRLEKNSSDGLALIEKYLEISKFETQISEASKENINIPKLILKLQQELHLDDKLDIKVNIQGFDSLLIDEISIRSIIQNFMTNAYKYGNDNGKTVFEVTLSSDFDYYYLEFKDNGIGIDLEKQGNKLFKPFIRIKQHEQEGSGVGLFIVKKIVNKLGGSINVTSKLGEGSTFTIKLLK